MKTDWLVKFLLLLAVIFLGIIAFRPYVAPSVVRAQSEEIYPLTFAPQKAFSFNGVAVEGNVMVDLRNGNIWGFPPLFQRTDFTDKLLPVSHPVLLGRLALEDISKK